MFQLELPIIPYTLATATVNGHTFTLMSGRFSGRWRGDPIWSNSWEVHCGRRYVARICEGGYGPGKYAVSLNQIRWMGVECPDIGPIYDMGPIDGCDLTATFHKTARRLAEILDARSKIVGQTLNMRHGTIRPDLIGGPHMAVVVDLIDPATGQRRFTFHGPNYEWAEADARWYAVNNGYQII